MQRILSVALGLFLLPLTTSAQVIPYTDVPEDVWFFPEVQAFLDQGYLDDAQQVFRPEDPAARAEFMKLVTELNGGILDVLPDRPSFNDVSPGDWFFGYLEESGREGWLRGDGDCYGTEPCLVRPRDPISRAEAAVIIRRAFGKTRLGKAPAFADNPAGSWYHDAVQAAADHCILRGDDGSRNVRPGDTLNRAEMVVMLYRVDHAGAYPDC